MQQTANLGLKKPEGTDVVNIADLNYNADKLDTEVAGIKNGTTKVAAAENAEKLGNQLPGYYAKQEDVAAHLADYAQLVEATKESFNIKVNAGTFDFSAKNLVNRKWIFSDGSISYDEQPTRTLSKPETVRLEGNFLLSPLCEINSGSTDSIYVGDLSDLPNLSHLLSLYNCPKITGDLSDLSNLSHLLSLYNCPKITGDLSDLSNLSYFLNLGGCSKITGDLSDLPNLSYFLRLSACSKVTGNLSDLPNLSYYLSLYNCPNITGDLTDLPNLSYYLNLERCLNITGDLSDLPDLSNYLNLIDCSNITGILNPNPTLEYVYLSNTGLTKNDVDKTVININNVTTIPKGVLSLAGLQRTASSTAAIESLISKGWTVTDATVV